MSNGTVRNHLADEVAIRATATGVTVAVVGLGKVGLPIAVQFAGQGARVIGCDINPAVVAAVNDGQTPIYGESELSEKLMSAHNRGLLTATTETSAGVREADVVVVIVPLMIGPDHEIDFWAIDSASRAVGTGLKSGALVIYETTLPVGTTRDRFGPLLERASGLRMGEDFLLAFSPERIRTGRIFRDLTTYPKIVGGINDESTTRAAEFYRTHLNVPINALASAETAEFTKLIECSYRDVNIALANEFAKFSERRGIDIGEAIEAANSQPQSHIHEPGIGVGGHCIPVYPYFLINNAEPDELQLQRRAREINDGMAGYAAQLLEQQLGDLRDRNILILGLSYRSDVKESAYSTTMLLVPELEQRGASVWVNDPLFSEDEIAAKGARAIALDDVDEVDAIVIQAHHRDYDSVPMSFFTKASVVLDGRGALDPEMFDGTGTSYLRVGTPVAQHAAASLVPAIS